MLGHLKFVNFIIWDLGNVGFVVVGFRNCGISDLCF